MVTKIFESFRVAPNSTKELLHTGCKLYKLIFGISREYMIHRWDISATKAFRNFLKLSNRTKRYVGKTKSKNNNETESNPRSPNKYSCLFIFGTNYISDVLGYKNSWSLFEPICINNVVFSIVFHDSILWFVCEFTKYSSLFFSSSICIDNSIIEKMIPNI